MVKLWVFKKFMIYESIFIKNFDYGNKKWKNLELR